jgi:ABC-type polysaccharide/polyol phosphate export permease
MNFQNWKILSTPEYHFLMLLIALLIGIVCLVILHEVRKTRAALTKILSFYRARSMNRCARAD